MPDFESANKLLPLLQQACKKFPQHTDYPAAVVSVSEQKLFLFINQEYICTYPVSTSRFGVGQMQGSNKTPLGVHYVKEKIGAEAQLNEIFTERKRTHTLATIEHDKKVTNIECITTRILWLSGLEQGRNNSCNSKGNSVDSYERYIYIHGTHEEGLIGQTASIGCVRMKNTDVVDLFDKLSELSLVIISE